MNLAAYALRNPQVAETLIGIEAYNATALDRISNHYARVLANRLEIAHVGNSDAHVVDAIGLGASEFEGNTAADLLIALKSKTTKVRKQNEWSMFKIMGSWALNYIGSVFIRLGLAAQ